MKSLVFLVAAGCLVLASGTMAQMRPGAKVEKTYGLGLPRDMDKLIPPDSDYPVYPLKPGQQAYKDVDGYRIKDTIKKINAEFNLKRVSDAHGTEHQAKVWAKLKSAADALDSGV